MKATKILSLLIFSIFLVSTVSAFGIIGGAFDDGSLYGTQSITITEGDNLDFNFDFFSDSSPMTININLHDSTTGNIITPFATNKVVTTPCSSLPEYVCYTGEETIPSNLGAGNYELIMSADNIGNSKTLFLTVNAIQDTNIPVITLLGSNPVIVTQGDTYTDAGATASDVEDGDITDQIIVGGDTVDTSTVGTYIITYNVQDSAGNFAAPVTRTISVVAETPDTTPPVITLLGNALEDVALDTTYIDASATALDNVDGDITADIVTVNPVDTSTIGIYTITYNVQDSAENSAQEVTRTVNVFDPNETTAPVITVITPEEGKEYDKSDLIFEIKVDEIAEVEFSLDNDPRVSMDYQGMSNGILTFVYDIELDDGDYEVTFYATDAAGNQASVTVEFSIDTSEPTKKDSKNGNTIGVNEDGLNFEEQLYLDQFKPKQIIYLDADEEPEKELTFWQRFIEWLKNLFGFE